MCDRNRSLTDPTADFVLADLITATENLLDFSINVLDTIRLQTHFNARNRRVCLGIQLKDVSDAAKDDPIISTMSNRTCTVTGTLKYDLALYVDRVLQACKRTKANLMLLRVSRTRSINTTLLLVASTNVRVEKLSKKVQLLAQLVKDNGGEFQKKKKRKKNISSNTKIDENISQSKQEKKQRSNLLSKEDLNDYVEITINFRMIIKKYREFIQSIRNLTKFNVSSNGQAPATNSFVLIPIASNAIDGLNNILNRLIRISFATEAESNYLRQPPLSTSTTRIINNNRELYREEETNLNKKETMKTEKNSYNPLLLTERTGPSRYGTSQREIVSQEYLNRSMLKRNTYSTHKKNDFRNQSALSSVSNTNSFQLPSDMISNIFNDFFSENTNEFLY